MIRTIELHRNIESGERLFLFVMVTVARNAVQKEIFKHTILRLGVEVKSCAMKFQTALLCAASVT